MAPKHGLITQLVREFSTKAPKHVPATFVNPTPPGKQKRIFLPGNQNAPILSGSLDSALPLHARMRANHFFWFCINVKMSCDVLGKISHTFNKKPLDAIELRHATHQTGVGYRTKGIHADFNKSADNMGDQLGTGVSSMDAAHFNNLGLTQDFLSGFDIAIGNSDGDLKAALQKLKDRCLTFCSDTRLLPQHINLKPDVIIDEVHRQVARDLFFNPGFNTGQLVSDSQIGHYINTATTAIEGSFTADEKKKPEALLYEMAKLYQPGYSYVKAHFYNELRPNVEIQIDELNGVLPSGIKMIEYGDYIGEGSSAAKPRSPELQEQIQKFRDAQKANEDDQTWSE
ncbi:hypothetical protein HU718_015655 [Pseudomonas tensinigenes]|uniref:Uncharacterized protein n=1 Tax=Pseudomonas tensinigenes TaxID=2745511 RepID=A0ABX8PQQ9_9PSED|nr:hypothetical protein [Pseudomonas tensinigenes]QXI03480.1 hypothetical protein HU718_015655 [Pseudomonas tensinigenes]